MHIRFPVVGTLLSVCGGTPRDKSKKLWEVRFPSSTDAPHVVELVISHLKKDLPWISLRSLALDGLTEPELALAAFKTLMDDFPALASLTLRKCAPSFVQALIVIPNSNSLCPLLRELRIQEIPLQESTLTDLVKSRLPDHAPMNQDTTEGSPVHLSRLVISECPGIDLPTVIGLRELSLDVQVLPKETILGA